MQDIIIAKPYRFVPPHRGDWVPSLVQRLRLVDLYLNVFEGVTSFEVRHVERLRESVRQQCGILIAPNHCRYADPIAIGWLAREAGVNVFAMASWHLFQQNWLQAFAMRMCGGFSVYREGIDRQSLDTAIDILARATRPLVVFPEGTVFRTNDHLQPLLDGVSFLARTAARRAAQEQRQVVIHPVGIKYLFRGDVMASVLPVIEQLEDRLCLQFPGPGGDVLQRVERLGEALLTLQEIRFLGRGQSGETSARRDQLIRTLLDPLEIKWLGRTQDARLVPRIKQLRVKMVPQLIDPQTASQQQQAIWADLNVLYLVQQVGSYPATYLQQPSDMRLLETVERLEEDITGRARIHRPLHAILQVDEPIVVETGTIPRGGHDPVMATLDTRLRSMLHELAQEARPVPGGSG